MRVREMREYHHDIQTAKNSSNRKAKPINTPSKKLNHHQQQSIKRNLSFAFTPITEDNVALNPSDKESIEKISSISESVDVHQSNLEISKTNLNSDHDLVSALQHPEQSIGISSVSEVCVSNEDQLIESVESYILSSKQFISPSSATTSLVELTPSSSLTTARDAATFIDSATHVRATTEDINPFKIESMINDLRESRESICQVLSSADLEPKYKKLFDALVKMVIEDSHSLHEENDSIMIVMLSFVLAAIVAGTLGFFLFSDAQSAYHFPPPT